MEDFYLRRRHVPAFGNWDYNEYDLPFTQCFETVTNPEGLVRYSYCGGDEELGDLYVAGDLYENDIVTPAMIVVPRRPKAKKTAHYPKVKGEKREGGGGGGGGGNWEMCDYEVKEVQSHVVSISPNKSPPSRRAVVPKAVDEDLYKISPHLLRPQYNKKKARGWLFSSCLRPTCVC
ncbi:hypothetical protein LIER_18187 [Lithospermum erythrorhizon]|uniref:Uncharacterized protein n=1 Tax=Lithospermum erythrorhizon TaxID=34254 RepID=A0AAV3QD32_LITER